jgi:hypothetical protein
VVRSPLSGERLTEYLLTVLEAKGGPAIRPNYMLHKKVRTGLARPPRQGPRWHWPALLLPLRAAHGAGPWGQKS